MPCPRTKLDPVASHKDVNGWWHFMCPICMISTPRTSRDYDQALYYFWREHDYRNKEKKMYVPSDLHEAYKMGVEAGTAAFGSEHVFPGTHHKVHTPGCELWGEPLGVRIEQLLKERRKRLLTQKVTKWVAILKGDERPLFPDPKLFNYKEEADKYFLYTANYVGAFPIEIETEL